MKKFMNFMGELFYDLTDYTMIILVLVLIAGILFWRFNALFDLSIDKDMIKDPVVISEGDKDKNDSSLISDSDNMPNKDDSNSESTDENNDNSNPTDNSDSSNESSSTDENSSDDSENSDNSSDSSTTGDNTEESNTDSDDHSVTVNIDVKFTIPTGTFPSQIADILIDNRLIDDKQKFLTRCVELGLDTKLKAGDFTINTSSSLDEIIKRIAR